LLKRSFAILSFARHYFVDAIWSVSYFASAICVEIKRVCNG